jgi:hypothetical protein
MAKNFHLSLPFEKFPYASNLVKLYFGKFSWPRQEVPEDQNCNFVWNANLLGDQPIVAAPAYIGIVVFFLDYSFVY